MKKGLIFLVTAIFFSMLVACSADDTLNNDFSEGSKSEQVNGQQSTSQGQNETKLTKEEAQEIALKHANLTANDVTNLYTVYEIDDRIPQYDVHFRKGHVEYEYDIHAQTGEILSFERD